MAAFMACFMVACSKEDSGSLPKQEQNGQQGQDGNNDDPDDQPAKPSGEAPDANVGADNFTDEVVTGGCAELGATYIVLYGYVNNATPSEMGIIYDTDQKFPNKQYAYSSAFDPGTSNRRFHVNIEGLDKGQKYYYYAFIKKNNLEYTAEEIYSFTTNDEYGPDDTSAKDVDFLFDDNFTLTPVKEGDRYPYYTWTEPGFETWWASGNAGYRLTGLQAQPLDYPTAPEFNTGVDGKNCLKLTTRDTGNLGAMAGMRIAAGALFTGSFDSQHALGNTLAATRMGVPYAHKPIKMSGYYKYQPGDKLLDRSGREITGVRDSPDIFCVVYKNVDEQGNNIQLDGSNILSSPAIVGLGRIKPTDIDASGSQWVYFDLPIEYAVSVDSKDVKNKLYSTAIVLTSSIRGAEFVGAPGSTLWIDNVKLESEY